MCCLKIFSEVLGNSEIIPVMQSENNCPCGATAFTKALMSAKPFA
jgi:hypothetical protein